MLRKVKPKDHSEFISIVLSPGIVCFCIYIWVHFGCLGYSRCSLCQGFTPEPFLSKLHVNFTTNDFQRLINLDNFKFLMNNLKCNKSDPLLLVLVHSHPENIEKRWTIRETWGQIVNDNFKLLFLMGIPYNASAQKQIEEENAAFGDLVQGNFMDTYRNLTYKHVMALKWTKYFCPRAKYLLKADDDVFINSRGLLDYVKFHAPQSKLIRCLPVYDGRPYRTWRSKWRVGYSEYEFSTYPTFCQGFSVLYNKDVVSVLYAKAQKAKYFWIDDVFITGILSSAVNVTPSTFEPFVMNGDIFWNHPEKYSDHYPYLLGPWDLEVENIRNLWEKIPKEKTTNKNTNETGTDILVSDTEQTKT